MAKFKAKNQKRAAAVSGASPCSVEELAKRIATEILTVGGVRCTRAVMMKGKYPDGERDMGGRNAASITFVVREHLIQQKRNS